MMHTIDVENWKRKEQYEFFSAFDDPFYGFTVNVDCTRTYQHCKAEKKSFFLCSLHRIVKAINTVEEFRYRIVDGKVVCFDKINAGTTVGRDDETFGFGFFEYFEDEDEFIRNAQKEIQRIQSTTGLAGDEEGKRVDLIRFSPVPWIAFTDLKHAANMRTEDTASRISTGKIIDENGRKMLPLSLTAHHGLTDGIHAGKFLKALEEIL